MPKRLKATKPFSSSIPILKSDRRLLQKPPLCVSTLPTAVCIVKGEWTSIGGIAFIFSATCHCFKNRVPARDTHRRGRNFLLRKRIHLRLKQPSTSCRKKLKEMPSIKAELASVRLHVRRCKRRISTQSSEWKTRRKSQIGLHPPF